MNKEIRLNRRLFNDKEKWCPLCRLWLPLDKFWVLRSSPSGRDSYCIKDRKEYDKKYNRRSYVRKARYGLTQEEYNAVFKKQKGKCAICERSGQYRLAHDHDHQTGKFRGLVCNACNLVLGRFKDDEKILEKAIKYLNQHR